MRGLGTSVASECFLCNLRRGASLFSREHRYGNKQLQLRLPGPAKTQSERKGGSRTQLGLPRDRCHTWEGGSGVLLGRTAHGLATALSLTRFFPEPVDAARWLWTLVQMGVGEGGPPPTAPGEGQRQPNALTPLPKDPRALLSRLSRLHRIPANPAAGAHLWA